MKKITDPLRWALKGLFRLIDRAAYWLYSNHDRKHREWADNNRISEETSDEQSP